MKALLWAILIFLSSSDPLTAQDWAQTRLSQSPRHGEWIRVEEKGGKFDAVIVYPERKDKTVAVILIHYVTRAIIPGMLRREEGHVVNIGSISGRWVYPNGNVYCATKFAVRALTEGLRQDLQGSGQRVTEIAPGLLESEFSRVRFHGDADRARKVYADTTPLTPLDIAQSVLWCVQRPKHVNVQELVIFPTSQPSIGIVERKPNN